MEYLGRGISILREQGIIALIKRSLRYIFSSSFSPPHALYAFLALKFLDRFKRLQTLDELLNFVYNGAAGSFKPLQVREEIFELLRILEQAKPKIILEIGTALGGLLLLFTRVAHKDATVISVDLPGGRSGGGYPIWRIPVYKSFPVPNTKAKIYLIRADSHSYSTLEKIQAILNSEEVDFLFIDGDHTYEGVRKDFEMYSPLVKSGGIVGFHDIVVHPPESGCEVDRFWGEIKVEYNSKEIVRDWNQKWAGIGLLRKN